MLKRNQLIDNILVVVTLLQAERCKTIIQHNKKKHTYGKPRSTAHQSLDKN